MTDSSLLPQAIAPRVDLRLVGLAYAGLLTFAAASPRGAAAVLVLIGCMAVVANGLHRVALARWIDLDAWTLSLLAFAALAALSAIWSPDPANAVGKAALLSLMILAVNAAVVTIRRDAREVLRAALVGILVAVIAAAALTVFETVTNQALTRKLLELFPALQAGYEKHIRLVDGAVAAISPTNINRRTALLTLLLWPAACAAAVVFRGPQRLALLGALAAAALVILCTTHHQSSQVALLTGFAAFALYTITPRWTPWLLAAGWTAAVLLMVPLAQLAYQADVHKQPGMFQSAQHRVVIWGYTAEQIAKRPLLGVGADATAKLDAEREAGEIVKADDTRYARTTSRHAHNVYLQVWYELGLLGALVFLPIGLFAVRAVRFTSPQVQPWAAALLAASAAMISFSYSLWQVWFQATFGIAIVAIALIDTLKRRLPE